MIKRRGVYEMWPLVIVPCAAVAVAVVPESARVATIGAIGTAVSTVMFIPQMLRVWRHRSSPSAFHLRWRDWSVLACGSRRGVVAGGVGDHSDGAACTAAGGLFGCGGVLHGGHALVRDTGLDIDGDGSSDGVDSHRRIESCSR